MADEISLKKKYHVIVAEKAEVTMEPFRTVDEAGRATNWA